MAYIEYFNDSDIPERDRVPDSDNILRIHGVNSRVMKSHFELYTTLMKRSSPVSKKLREMIAVVVSAANNCYYWTQHHEAGLRQEMGKESKRSEEDMEKLISSIKHEMDNDVILPEERAVLLFTLTLTQTPGLAGQKDVDELKSYGYSDRAIHDIAAITAYFNFVNRMASGLGVELEDRFNGKW